MRTPAGRGGFTLIEILLALALVGLVLVGMNSFIFSMGELWGKNTDARLFDQHVRAVTRYLQGTIRSACLPPAVSSSTSAITVPQINTPSAGTDSLVTFTLLSGSRLLSWPERPLPEVVCSLQVRTGAGLFLLWHSDLEKRFNDDPPRETLISPFVTSMTYDYYDPDMNRWTTEVTPRKDNAGNGEAPQRLHLSFAYGKMTRETYVIIPTIIPAMPNPL